MKHKYWSTIIASVAMIGMVYSIVACIYLQIQLTSDLEEIPDMLFNMGNLVGLSLVVIGLYHLLILVQALKRIDGSRKNALFIIMVILSGVFLLSDVALLSDIGKEYRLFDVAPQWYMLYGFFALHVIVLIIGTLKLNWMNYAEIRLFQQDTNMVEVSYLSIHHITMLSGIIGLAGVLVSALTDITTPQYRTALIGIATVLALLPVISNALFWAVKFRNRRKVELFDEKQIYDSAIAALISMSLAVGTYLLIIFLELTAIIHMPAVFWIALILFFQMAAYGTSVIIKIHK